MRRFGDLKILTKLLTLMGLLALVSLAATVFTTREMRYIDDTYGDLIDGPGKANLAIARANRDLVYVDRSIYRLLTEVTEDGNTQAIKEITDTKGFFDGQIKAAVRGMPDKGDQIKRLADRFGSALSGVCAETITLGNSLNAAPRRVAGRAAIWCAAHGR
jgi:methyl-accepting chemotaxis protein